jgi:hypothetical protein
MRNKPIVIVFMVISALLVVAVYSLSTFVVFAAPPYHGSVITCTKTYYKTGQLASMKCCYDYYVGGKKVKSFCDPWSCYNKDGSEKKCKNTLTKGQPGYPVTTSGGALQDNGTANSNNNTTPLRLNVTLNATSSTNPNAVLKDGGHFKDGGLMARPQKGSQQSGPINAAPPVSNVVVTVTFNSITVHNKHEGALSGDGEYDLVAYVQGRIVRLTDASVNGDLYDVEDGQTVNFKPGTQIITELPKTFPLSIFTIGTEVDGCGKGAFPDNIQQDYQFFSDPQYDWRKSIPYVQEYFINYAVLCKTTIFTNTNDVLGTIDELYHPPGYGVGPHEVKSSTGDFTLRYTISTGNACNASIC